MVNSTLITPKLEVRTFKRREHLPLRENSLWQIEAGAVRTYTLTEDGTVISLGFWGLGDTVGKPLALIQPYEVECLTDVRVCTLQPKKCSHLDQVLLSHLHQTQTLLRLRSGQIHQRLQQLLDWLADKFGYELEQGQLIKLRLTHQDIADTLGTTRVTVTRLLNQFEQQGRICWVNQHLLLPRNLQFY
jgi:CRP-like cAMP-binding protein